MSAYAVLQTTGGSGLPTERRGDVVYVRGAREQASSGELRPSAIADLIAAGVRLDGETLVFDAQVAAPRAEPLRKSGLELRWQLTGEDGSAWTLSASMTPRSEVALVSQDGFGLGTIDRTLPADLTIAGNRVSVHLRAREVESFPGSFEWSLTSTLRAVRNDPGSSRVEDRFPDEGTATGRRVFDRGS